MIEEISIATEKNILLAKGLRLLNWWYQQNSAQVYVTNCCVLCFKAKSLNFDKFTTPNVPCKLLGKTMGLNLGTIFSEEW